MKPIRNFVCAALFCIPFAIRAEEAGIGEGRVTIPYPELRALLDAVEEAADRKPDPIPPVDAALARARYRLDFSGSAPSLTADFQIDAFTDEWHSVPLLGGDLLLESATLTSGDASVIRRNGHYVLLAKGRGKFAATVSLGLPAPGEWEKGDGVVLEPAPASVGELRIFGRPGGREIRIDGIEPTPDGDGGLLFPLPGDEGRWRMVLEEDSAADGGELPSAWVLHSQILLRYVDGRLLCSARIQGQADSGSGLSMALALPANATAVSVESEDLDDWRLEPRDGASRLLRISWETPDLLDRTLLLRWEVPQSPLAEVWEIAPPRIVHPDSVAGAGAGAESRALVAVVPVEGLELTHPALQNGVGSLRLPEWMRGQLGDEDAATTEIAGDARLSLSAAWLPRLETAQATVSDATFATRLVADGSTLVTAEFVVRHSAPIVWKLELPPVDEILACTVAGENARPIRRSDTAIEFRLAAPAALGTESPSTRVGLSYSMKADPLDPVSGRVALELPLTSLFIHRLEWELSIPEDYEPTAVEGNVRLSTERTGKSPGSRLIHLQRELCRGERPAVEIHYQRSDLSAES